MLAATARAQLGPGTTRSDDTARAPAAPPAEPVGQPGSGIVPYRAPRVTWNPAWTRFDLENYIIFGTGVTLAIGGYLLGPRADKSRGGVLLDEDVRSGLRLRTLGAERFARDASDVLLSTLVSYPFFDSLVISGWYRQSSDVAEQTALINAEAMAFTAGLHAIATVAFSRERPFGRLCGSEKPEDGRDCDSRNRYFSFFSGHSSQAFNSAGLICIHHHYLKLYGGGAGDGLVCAAGFVLAAATATLRVAGDQHYLSDVVVGAAVGTLSGLGVPWLFHYRGGAPVAPDRSRTQGLRVRVTPTPNGAAIVGSFP